MSVLLEYIIFYNNQKRFEIVRAKLFAMKNAQPSTITKHIGVYFHRHDRTCIDALQRSDCVQVHNSNGIKT